VTAAGEVVWVGVESLGERDGRVALYLADHLTHLLPPTIRPTVSAKAPAVKDPSDREAAILDVLGTRGASFFGPLHDAAGGGYPAESVDAIWNLVWRGLVTNDTFHALRAFTRVRAGRRKARRVEAATFRSRRQAPPSAEGRWTVVPAATAGRTTKWAAAMTQQLLARHGVITREAVAAENVPGGFGLVYSVLKRMEDNGRVRRGYFVAGLGATQFALPGALDLLRSLRDAPDAPEVVVLAATDPANPYGAALKFGHATIRALSRSVGAMVVLLNGALVAYLARGDRMLTTFLPVAEPERSKAGRAIARVLIERARSGVSMLIEEIDGAPAAMHPLKTYLAEAGFADTALGYQASDVGRQSQVFSPQSTTASRQSRSTVSSPFARRYLDTGDPPAD
jgi:ATP-dependent Lhr-like helicase